MATIRTVATQNGAESPQPVGDPRRGQAGEHGAAHAHAVDAQCDALALGRVPAVDEGTPTANDAPAKPSRKPKARMAPSESWKSASAISGSGVKAISAVNTRRPP